MTARPAGGQTRCASSIVPQTSIVNLDSVENVSVGTLVERLGRLSDERMRQVCNALEIAVGCEL